MEAIGLYWVKADVVSQASMELAFKTAHKFVGLARTEEGIEGRRNGQLGQLGLGGVIVRLLKGQRGSLGGRGNQIGFPFKNGRHLKLEIGVVGDALLLEIPK